MSSSKRKECRRDPVAHFELLITLIASPKMLFTFGAVDFAVKKKHISAEQHRHAGTDPVVTGAVSTGINGKNRHF